ncbi:MAG: polyprenyl synthetase family protein [Candidatus Marisimplicoccus sp.]|nr:MAG: Octaprenyl diphosphate synthase [Flavobacteriales bacterium]
MKVTHKIKKPILQELKIFEKQFYNSVSSKVKLLDLILIYILNRKGKQIRPILVLLFAKMFSNGKLNQKSYRAANLVELIHTASLIHDDIVDDSNIRRNFLTINALWKNKISVLVGDFFLSKALLLSTKNKDYDLLNEVSIAVKEISEGELLQIQKSKNFNLSEENYMELISKKTASLFSCCCKVGSISSEIYNLDDIEMFGNYLGIIFQIKDDLFDYTTKRIGKPNKLDLKTQKITLPLIHSINKSNYQDRKNIKSILKRKRYTMREKKLVNEFIVKYKGFDYANKIMHEYKFKALEIMNNFPENDSKNSIKILLDYIIERKY